MVCVCVWPMGTPRQGLWTSCMCTIGQNSRWRQLKSRRFCLFCFLFLEIVVVVSFCLLKNWRVGEEGGGVVMVVVVVTMTR